MQTLLSACVFMMMFCIGLDFSCAQWLRLIRAPRPIFVGLLIQNVGIPVVAFGIAWFLKDSPEVALAIILIAASPGGPVANAVVHYAKARIDLSISLTVINGLLCVFTAPLIADLGFVLISGADSGLVLPFVDTVKHLLFIIVIPISIGIILNQFAPYTVQRIRQATHHSTLLLLVGTILIILVLNIDAVSAGYQAAIPALVLFSIAMIFLGIYASRLSNLADDFGFAIANEVSIHNVPLALLMANSMLNKPELSGAIILYVPVIFSATLLNAYLYKKHRGYFKVER